MKNKKICSSQPKKTLNNILCFVYFLTTLNVFVCVKTIFPILIKFENYILSLFPTKAIWK
jgi:hypothetical protein